MNSRILSHLFAHIFFPLSVFINFSLNNNFDSNTPIVCLR